jgi:uncharacterized membrane protein (UPF0127 family)
MRAVWTRPLSALLFALAVLQLVVPSPPASALEKGKVVIDGRVTIDVEVVRTAEAQAKGLSGRSSLKKGRGMGFPYDEAAPRSFWMKGMLIPIDILWVRDGRIVAIEAKIPPPAPNAPLAVFSHVADLVLEMSAGYAREMGIRVGQAVQLQSRALSRGGWW